MLRFARSLRITRTVVVVLLLAASSRSQPVATTVTADSVHSRFRASHAIDGDSRDDESRWASAARPGEHWLELDFEQEVTIDAVVVQGQAGDLAILDLEVQAWVDEGWKRLTRIEDNDQARITLKVGSQRLDRLRVVFTRACRRDDRVRLYEIELYRSGRRIALRQDPFSRSAALAVEPLAMDQLAAPGNSPKLSLYYESIAEWGDILLSAVRPVPGQPGQIYLGEGGHRENEVRPIAYAALVSAFLSEVPAPEGSQGPSTSKRKQMRRLGIGLLRYLVESHGAGEGACLDGRPWGGQWQSAMWTRSVGLAGWMLWRELEPDMQARVATVVAHEADRILSASPKSSRRKDTGAEENAWNSQILSLAANMMPRHERSARWAQAAKRWAYNSLSVSADRRDESLGDDEKTISQWVTTTNVHDDFTIENHDILHIGYLKTSIALLLESALPYRLTGAPIPQGFLHHTRECFEVVLRCMGWDGSAVYVCSNDWKLLRTQGADVVLYALMGLFARDPGALRLEDIALQEVKRTQYAEDGHFSVRRDLEYDGTCASRLITAYLAHVTTPDGLEPASEEALSSRIEGVSLFSEGRVLVHRTATKLASISWGAKRLALAMPGGSGDPALWPHPSSTLGYIGERPSSQGTKVLGAHPDLRPDGFTMTMFLERQGGSVEQAVAYASLPIDVTVYIERLTPRADTAVHRETGVVGLEYGLSENERLLHGSFGEFRTRGLGDPVVSKSWKSDWLNIEDRVGYVMRRHPETVNVVRYHDAAAGAGRVPKLQEWISLLGDEMPESLKSREWACVVTLLNADAETTEAASRSVTFEVLGEDRSQCQVGETRIVVDFASSETRIVD